MELNEACHSLAETLVYFSCEKLIFLACTNLLRKVLTDFSSCIGGTLTIYIIRHRTLKQSVYRLSHTCFFAGKQFSPNKVLFSPSLDENVCILLNNFLQAIRIKIMQQASWWINTHTPLWSLLQHTFPKIAALNPFLHGVCGSEHSDSEKECLTNLLDISLSTVLLVKVYSFIRRQGWKKRRQVNI